MAARNPPDNPYLAARQEWNERYGSYVKAAAAWRIVGIVAMLMAVIGFAYAKDRNDRAREELCAEIGSALVCADLGIVPELEPRPDHASYLASWLTVLSNDRRAIFSAAAHAQRAAAYLHSLQPQADSEREAA